MNITINNLTKRQKTIAERLWRCETSADVDRYISMLPKKEQRDARGLMLCMLQQAAEQDTELKADAEMITRDLLTRIQ